MFTRHGLHELEELPQIGVEHVLHIIGPVLGTEALIEDRVHEVFSEYCVLLIDVGFLKVISFEVFQVRFELIHVSFVEHLFQY